MMVRKQMVSMLVGVLACWSALAATQGPDPHSYARFDQVISTHLVLDLDADFDSKQVRGTATHRIERIDPAASQFIVDTRELHIDQVQRRAEAGAWQDAAFELAEADPLLGQALTVMITDNTAEVRIHYTSSPGASGLQWLEPEQTSSKKYPFMFSQSQAIHARSWIPLQDTPAVRTPYDATVRVPKTLRAVMSADNDADADMDGEFEFTMPQPIPSYLLAIAAGELEFAAMGERSGVYAEPSVLASAVHEFSDTEEMIELTEAMYGPYRWGRYDLLILPPSFPFGGMENPRLSFITPTVIAGDRSLVNLIAHELAHSWSGNLVTNSSWGDLWLNEGFTSYVENRIMEALFGEERAVMEQVLTMDGLYDSLQTASEEEKVMARDAKGYDPDDVFSAVAYSKGQLFLMDIEQHVGREFLDPWMRAYFDAHAFQSIDTAGFKKDLMTALAASDELKTAYPESRIDQWLHGTEIPQGAPRPTSNRFDPVDQALADFSAGTLQPKAIDIEGWTPHEWLRFINQMPSSVTLPQMAAMDEAFDLTNSMNAEIAHAWYLQGIRRNYQPAIVATEDYLMRIGRIKLVAPLYMALMVYHPDPDLARRWYDQASPGYHPLTRMVIQRGFNDATGQVADAAAKILINAHNAGQPLPLASQHFPRFDTTTAWATQAVFVADTVQSARGFKAGLTSLAARQQFGIEQSIAGVLDSSMVLDDKASVRHMTGLRAEAELGLVLNQAVTEVPETSDQLMALGSLHMVAELPRINFTEGPLTATDLVAANAASYKLVLGQSLTGDEQGELEVELRFGDEVLISAQTTLSEQAELFKWLMQWALDQGYSLQPGDVLIAGAIGGNVAIGTGRYSVSVNGQTRVEFDVE